MAGVTAEPIVLNKLRSNIVPKPSSTPPTTTLTGVRVGATLARTGSRELALACTDLATCAAIALLVRAAYGFTPIRGECVQATSGPLAGWWVCPLRPVEPADSTPVAKATLEALEKAKLAANERTWPALAIAAVLKAVTGVNPATRPLQPVIAEIAETLTGTKIRVRGRTLAIQDAMKTLYEELRHRLQPRPA